MSTATTEDAVPNEQVLIDRILGKARSSGADARITIRRQESWEAGVATGSIEQLTSFISVKLSLSLYFPDGRFANVSSNDLREFSIDEITESAIALAQAGQADPHRKLPPAEKCGRTAVGGLDDKGAHFSAEAMLQALLKAEAQARRADRRVIGFDHCAGRRNREHLRLVDSRGTDIVTTQSDYSISIDLAAEHDGEKQMGYDFAAARCLRDLRPASDVARTAVERAVRGFGWKKATSGPMGVVFDHNVASELLGVVKSLASGDNFLGQQSYWVGRIDTAVASDCMTIIDDPLVAGGIGSRECDQEGVRARPLNIVENGILRSIMTDAYAAGKLNLPLTGHAGGVSNLILRPGSKSQAELLAELGTGFFVTEIQGHGIDLTAGTWSRGANGFWVEQGKITHPVQGVTVAGKLDGIFKGVTAVGNDPRRDTPTSSPSLLIPHGLTLGGE